LALLAAVILRTPLPDPGTEKADGVSTDETPFGNPDTERATAALKPPLTVTLKLTLLFPPATTEREFAESAA
jgi:hypothetical protein